MEYKYSARIYWQHYDPKTHFNDVCIWVMETFGLPGNDNYITAPHEDYMDFIFVKECDLIHFKLRWY